MHGTESRKTLLDCATSRELFPNHDEASVAESCLSGSTRITPSFSQAPHHHRPSNAFLTLSAILCGGVWTNQPVGYTQTGIFQENEGVTKDMNQEQVLAKSASCAFSFHTPF